MEYLVYTYLNAYLFVFICLYTCKFLITFVIDNRKKKLVKKIIFHTEKPYPN